MGIDPVTARAGLRTAREIINGRHITYPVPYILVILCALCVGCLLVANFALDAVRIIALILACSAFAVAAAILAVAIFVKPELLRSEHHQQTMRLIDILGDKDMDAGTREHISHVVFDPGDRLTTKTGGREKPDQQDMEHGEQDG